MISFKLNFVCKIDTLLQYNLVDYHKDGYIYVCDKHKFYSTIVDSVIINKATTRYKYKLSIFSKSVFPLVLILGFILVFYDGFILSKLFIYFSMFPIIFLSIFLNIRDVKKDFIRVVKIGSLSE